MHFYAYALIDPRDNKPFYIGKGQRYRYKYHFREARNTTKNSKKLQKIRKIESLGLEVIVKKLIENVSDSVAKEVEMFVIAECLNFGVNLCNETMGGEGSVGYKHSKESLAKISASQKGKKVSEETRKKISDYVKKNNPMHKPEVVAKISGSNSHFYGRNTNKTGKLNVI
jgi:hypothetical protein